MPNIKYRAVNMYPKQRAAFDALTRYVFVEGSTKSGKTAGALDWQFREWINDDGAAEHWWVAPVYGQANIAFARVKRMFHLLIRAKLLQINNTDKAFVNRKGCVWRFRSALNEDNLYGEDVASLVLDEASRASEEAFISCRSTLTATEGKMRAIGNIRGTNNWFYRRCRQIEKNLLSSNYSYHKLTSTDAVEAGVLSAKEIEDARLLLPAAAFSELYLCEAQEGIASFFRFPFNYAKGNEKRNMTVRAWDFAATEPSGKNVDPDRTCGLRISKLSDAVRHIVDDVITAQVGPDIVTKLVIETAQEDGPRVPILIEEEPGASGKLTTAFFKSLLPGYVVEPIKSESKKQERAFQVAVAQNSGHLLLEPAGWNILFENELISFTGGKDDAHDDQVDALAIGYNWLTDYDPLPEIIKLGGQPTEKELVHA